MNNEKRSAEWLRGAAYAIERLYFDWPAKSALIAHYASELTEAEALEALHGGKEKMALSRIYEIASRQLAEPSGMGDAVAMAKICTEVETVHLTREGSVPTAADLAVADELDMLAAHIQEYIGPDDARDDIRRICRNRAADLRRGVKRAPSAAEVIAAAEQALSRALTTRSFGTTFDLSSAATECTNALALIAKYKEAHNA